MHENKINLSSSIDVNEIVSFFHYIRQLFLEYFSVYSMDHGGIKKIIYTFFVHSVQWCSSMSSRYKHIVENVKENYFNFMHGIKLVFT